jgi:hypothetical protein
VPIFVRTALVNLGAEADQTYYFRTLITAHPGFYSVDFEPVNSDEGRLLVEMPSPSDYQPKK